MRISRGIYVNLSGGLGNQMMQLYAADQLAKHFDQSIFINLTWFDKNYNNKFITKRKFELECFRLCCRYEVINVNSWNYLLLNLIGTRVKSKDKFESLLCKKKSLKPIMVNHHFADIAIDHEKFKQLFKWKVEVFSNDLIELRKKVFNYSLPAIFIRKDDWIRLDPASVVNESCFEQSLERSHEKKYFIVGQIGQEPLSFEKLKVKTMFIDDCGKGWTSYEKMFLLSASTFLYTSKSTYGRCTLYMTNNGMGKIIEPCRL
ncbi:hypothetical protein N9B83_00085 [Schleiferiaceae bacterium]|nr:hypothetical protein [Schleiferiaceae bacterium]